MSSRLNLTFFAALAIQMLMIGATAAPLAAGLNPMGNYDKMDKSLRDSLSSSSEDEIVPVIFQLNSDVTAEDLEILESLGATILGEAPLVDGGLFEASIRDVRIISTWERIEYLELDRVLDFFYLPSDWGGEPITEPGIMMHETTHVVKATDAWDRVIISPYGIKSPGVQGSSIPVSVIYIVSVGVREKVKLSQSISSLIQTPTYCP